MSLGLRVRRRREGGLLARAGIEHLGHESGVAKCPAF